MSGNSESRESLLTAGCLTDLLEGARAECERRMAELAGNGERGREIPREWFALNSMERRLRPLVHEAARIEGKSRPVYTRIDALLDVADAARDVVVLEYSSAATDEGNEELVARARRLRTALEALDA